MIIHIDKTTMRKFWMISALALSSVLMTSCGGNDAASGSGEGAVEEVNYYSQLANQSVDAVLWSSVSAEAHFMYKQSYARAKELLRENMGRVESSLPPAVVLDLDETVLDNSPYMIQLIRDQSTFSESSWEEWVKASNAQALPGAVDFLNYCQDNGVEIFYISNRSMEHFTETQQNLENLKLPFADFDHILLMDSDLSDKSDRRARVESSNSIVLFCGDNLRDFKEDFKGREENFGKARVDEMEAVLLQKFVLFPNPMYGEWTRLFVRSNPEEEVAQKAAVIDRLGQ